MFDLQFFADAGTLVNATGSFVNASTGETTDFDSAHSLSSELKSFYDTELLENARSELFYAQFAKRQPLPANHHGVVEWRKWNTFDKASKLSEGVIPTGQKFGVTAVTGTVDQYGTYTAITDKLELRAYDDVILGATEEMGASAAETQEALIRDALFTNTNVLYCDKIARATGAVAATPAAQSELAEDETCACRLTPEMVNKAVTVMKKNRVPRIGGKYYAVIHPSVAHDLRADESWIEAHKYASPEEVFNGEIGELHGVRFIEDVFAPVLKGADLASDARSLKVNYASGYSGAITSLAFDGGTVAEDALIGRVISINGVTAKITDNTASAISFASTNFGSVADNADILPADFGADDIAAYASYFFGKDSFGIIDPEGGALEMIIHDKGEIGGPLNQFSTIGYKFETNGATILYPERLLRVMSTSSFSAADEAN
ncbi:MAG: N4-gp56 family major capsid protein [Oscillospiraceae bacterium]|nr:N4-gp56 family major capsid protein [Oscillospiraceae bacterium]